MSHSGSKYALLNQDELDELYSNYLVDSWSYSKLAEFSRNEKGFEMIHVYGQRPKFSSTTIAGQAYHEAMKSYFDSLQTGEVLDLAALELIAFNYIDSVKPFVWKLQKTTPTVLDCIEKATVTCKQLLLNFLGEVSTYLDEIQEILFVEVYCNEFIIVNGVEIPMPCHAKIDLVIRSKSGAVVIIDHKTKQSFSSEEEISLSIGRQAMTYTLCFESKTNIHVDEAWFVENKYSKNRDGSPQLNAFKVSLDHNIRKLYESLLYEPLRRMIQAVSDPDYVYMINDNDSFLDKAEVYNFWAKTMIAEVEDFNVLPSKKDLVKRRLKKIRDASLATVSPNVIKRFKENASEFIKYDFSDKDMTQEEKIEHVLRSFGIIVRCAHVLKGFSSNTCLLEVSAGVKITSISSHKLDIANVLDVSSVRISKDLVIYEDRSYVGIEFSKVRDGDVLFDPKYLQGMKLPIGIDNFGNTVVWDLNNQSTPHVLVCGGTGSGKSVSVRSTIEFALLAGVDQIEILDPKFEFTEIFAAHPNVSVYNEIESIEQRAEELVELMNEMIRTGKTKKILVVLDEFADAYMMAKSGKELEIRDEVQDGFYAPKKLKGPFGEYLSEAKPKFKTVVVGKKKSLEENMQSLLQKGRSSGFRLILATQRADAKTISGSAKVNLPVQICFKVQKEVDSRVVIDEAGAETLAGRGDGLIRSPQYSDIVRFQAFYKPD